MKIHLPAVGILSGTIIGAGIFALPYVFQQSGLLTGFFYLLLAAAAYTTVYLLYADVVLRTDGEHRMVGYAEKYLGSIGYWLMVVMTLVGSLLVLTIYLVLAESFMPLVLPWSDGIFFSLTFWFIGTLIIFSTLRRFALVETLIVLGLLGIIAIVFWIGAPSIALIPVATWIPIIPRVLQPLGPVLFALSGSIVIPLVVSVIGVRPDRRTTIRNSIALGVFIPAVLYALFVLAVVGISGTATEDAVSGLVGKIPTSVMVGLGVLGLLALFSSYIAIGLHLRQSIHLDLGWGRLARMLVVGFGPALLYLAGLRDFIMLVSFVGGVFLGLEGILLVLMWIRAKKISPRASIFTPRLGMMTIVALLFLFTVALVQQLF